MPDYRFERECRTPYSEVYAITADGDRIVGKINLHFAAQVVNAVLCVGEDMTTDDIRELISIIDEELVLPADLVRDDFIVTVYQGREIGVFSDEEFGEEDSDDWN
ncbi:MAG: hypothetical protein ACLFVK_01275 [Dehalococcoidia bacterium]